MALEVAGAITTITALIATCNQAVSFVGGVVKAGTARNAILQELRFSILTLYKIKDAVGEYGDQVSNLRSLTVKGGWADHYKELVEALVDKLVKKRGLKDVYKRIKFVVDEADIQNELDTLQRYRSHFEECLSVDQL